MGNVKVGVRFVDATTHAVSALRYFHTDHLGSVSVITDQNGAVVEKLSYDAWGKRRQANGADDPAGAITSQTDRGYTGHEQLDTVGLVHMNGRVYDPLVARMISADPTVPDAMNAQAWNRYSYVGNDPLTFTDPSGFSWLSDFFHGFFNSLRDLFQRIPILRAIVQIVITTALTFVVGPYLAAAAGAAIINGISGGNLGSMLKSAAIAAATAFAFNVVGTATSAHAMPGFNSPDFDPGAYAANVAGHAGVGCLTAVASGGKCGPGALSGAAGAAASSLVGSMFPNARDDLGQRLGGAAVSGAVGGLASVAGGGKFEDGAVTAAFGYMFNQMGHNGGPPLEAPAGTAAGLLSRLLGPVAILLGMTGEANPVATDSPYPPNGGSAETPKDTFLEPGTRIDRYGPEGGSYFAPYGTPIEQRALHPDTNLNLYQSYEVVSPIPAQQGTAAPWFDQPGGGTQFRTPYTAADMVRSGVLRRYP